MLRRTSFGIVAAVLVTASAVAAGGHGFTAWEPAQKIDEIDGNSDQLNTPVLDGCPIQSPDGLSLYIASTRDGGKGKIDIWVARRPNRHAPWGAPENLGEPVNGPEDDFCPTPIRGGGLFFVSREALPGSCGMGDIYFTRYSKRHGWREPVRLACAPDGPNSALDEQGPSYVKVGRKAMLFFSRSSATVPGDIYVSRGSLRHGFGPASPIAELNDPAANDIQPNVRRDGLEVVFSSNRFGTLGGQDVWAATRSSLRHPFSTPVNLGDAVNTGAAETRPSLDWWGRQLLFGRAPGPEGGSDIYVTTRDRAHHGDDDEEGDDGDD